jgi:shikimate kinase
MRFVELDRHIEQRCGVRLAEVFSIHGEDFYRRMERDTLADLLASRQSMVLAVGGGLVTSAEAYNMLLRQTTTIWLKAKADDCWTRVIRQGDRRPMEQHPQAKDALKQLVARREPLYARAAFTVDTSALSIPQAVDRAERAAKLD